MSTLPHFTATFYSLSFHRQFSSHFSSLSSNLSLYALHRPHSPSICCCSIKKPRECSRSRKVKTNEELRNDIREFLFAVGLPHDHVPSMKEFSQHGRQDLANVVRRRGYKRIRELLATPTGTDVNMSVIKESLTEKQAVVSDGEENSTGQDGEKDSSKDVSLSSDASLVEDSSRIENIHGDLNLEDKSHTDSKPFMSLSLQEKVAKFIQNGELDEIDDSGFDISSGGVAEDDRGLAESPSATEPELNSLAEEHKDPVLCRVDAAKILDGSSRYSFDKFAHQISGDGISRQMRSKENQTEINRLKFMLHQKELKLSEMKQQIEKEKNALSILQAKAEREISKAQELVSEKDAELQAAEESLSGLEEVEIQYWGDGETVEVAGSFNGWHHRIKMDLQPSSSIMDPVGSRKSRVWSTVLWLYPGVYEIKFIVDGHWRIDPQRESIVKGTIHNNILRVDR